MKERGILFSGPMVRAILSGAKSQTRRLIKPQPEVTPEQARVLPAAWDGGWIDVKCPYGEPGDRLYVRETYALIWPGESKPENVRDNLVEYRADKPDSKYPGDWPDEPASKRDAPRWRPSLYMPRWASRITVEITSVRVERLQDISEADALAEGIDPYEWSGGPAHPAPIAAYRELWDTLNGKKAPWSSSPWVWVVEFTRVDADAKAVA